MAPKMKLVYFNGRGRAELLRLIFHQANVEFVDDRIEFADWPKRKGEAPHGQVPYLEMDGKKYAQSLPLARFLAKKYNLAGKNDMEFLTIDIIFHMIDDLRKKYVLYKMDPILTPEQKKTIFDKFKDEMCPAYYAKVEQMLTENKSGFLVGSQLTVADLALVDLGDQVEKEVPGLIARYPKVVEHQKKIRALPRLAAYLGKRVDTPI